MIPKTDSSQKYQGRLFRTISVIAIALSLLIISNSCFNRKKSSGSQTGSSAPVPGAFQTILPADGVININVFSAPVPVAWTASSNTASYILEVAKEDDFAPANMVYSANLGPTITSHSVTFGTLWGGVWYYWRVKAVNAYGTTISSDAPSCFYTSPAGTVPDAFTLDTPVDNGSGLELAPELAWTNAPKESKYFVYIDNDSDFSSPLYTDTTRPGELSSQIPDSAGLTETTRYYWKVDAYNPFGTRSSGTYSFVTGPIKSYTITPSASVITAGSGLTMTVTAYNSDNALVSAHNPFTLTMNSGTGLTYYSNSALTALNSTGAYTMTNGSAVVYVKITLAGSMVLTATDRAGRAQASPALTVNAGPVASLVVSGDSSINSGIESSGYSAVSYDINSNIIPDTYTWTKANNTGSATINDNKITGVLIGTVTVTATSNLAPAKSGAKPVTVVPGAVATVTVTGSDPITSGIQSSSYTAVSRDAAGNIVSDTHTWTKANGTGSATLSVDKLTGVLSGTVVITATSVAAPSKSGAKTVTVIPGAINSVTVSAPTATIPSGVETACTALSKDAAGNNVTDTFTWVQSNSTGTATFNTDKITGVLVGTVVITATSVTAPSKSGGQTVTVIPGAVATVLVSGLNQITSGIESSSYLGVSRDAAGNTVTDTHTLSKADGTGTATFNADKLTGVLAGTLTVTATSVSAPTKSGGKTVTVIPGAIDTVTVTGFDPITSGVQTSAYIATSRDTAGNTVSDTFTWAGSNNTGTATRNTDKLTGVISGTVTITATSVSAPTKSGGKIVTVIPGAVATVTVTGSDPITSGIQSSSYTATSTDAAGNIVIDTFNWSNANGTGTANRSIDKLTGVLSGTVTITATSVAAPSKSGAKLVTVIPGAVNSVTVSAPSGSIGAGLEYLCTASSWDAAGNQTPDTHSWTKANGTGTATLNVDKLTGILVGTVTITAASVANPTKTGNRTLTIIPGGLTYYTVVPSSSSVISWSTQSALVTAKDNDGNTVSTSTAVTITTSVVTATPSITFYTDSSYITATSGAYTLTNGAATIYYRARHDGTPPDGFTITAKDANNKEGTSAAVTVNNLTGPANKLLWVAQPTTPQIAGASWSALSIEVLDTWGNRCITDSATTVTLSVITGTGTFASGYTATASAGLATFSAVKYNKAESINIRGTAGGLTSTAVTSAITVNPAAASLLAFVQQPGNTTAGQTISPTITVRTTDAYSNIVAGVSVSISNAYGASMSGTLIRTGDGSGISSFNDLGITLANTYSLSASASGCAAITSSNFTINPAAANNLIFVQQPTNAVAGQTISPTITVRARDIYSNAVPSVLVTITTTNAAAMSGSVTRVSDGTGIASFNDLAINIADTYALSAASSGLTTIASDNFTVAAANASKLIWSVQPSSPQTAGAAWSAFSAQITDQYNNRVITSASVTLITATGTAGFTAGATVAAVSGVATFTATTYNRAETITLRATSGSLAQSPASNSVIINPTAANRLAFIQPPADTVSGGAFAPVVAVAVRDIYDNTVATATNPVSITVSAGSTLSGATTGVPASAGLASFTGVSITGIGTDRVMTATSAGLTQIVSVPFTVTAYSIVNNLVFVQQPTNTNAGDVISPTVTVRVRDVYGNPVSNTLVTVTNTYGAAMAGTLNRTSDSNGIASFDDLIINTPGTGYVLSATALSGAIKVNSNLFNVVSYSPAPVITAVAASPISVTGATLNAIINPNGLSSDYYFEWGTTIAYGNSSISQSAGSGTAGVPVSVTVTTLAASTTYYFRLTATSSGGTTNGSNLTFTTYPGYRGSGADGVLTVAGTFNINTNYTGSRSQADAWNSRVSALTADTATLVSTPPAGAIAAGDEIMLISLKGSSTAFTNTGNYEFLRVLSVSSNIVTFAWPKARYYGDAAGSDANCGTTQFVMLQRVPNYSSVAVPWAANLTCNGWNGTLGGVVAFRALTSVTVGSTDTPVTDRTAFISAYGTGHRGGTGVNWDANAPAGETYFGGLYASGGKAGSFSSQNGLTTPNPGGGGGGSSSTDGTGSTVGSAGTTGPAGGGGGGAKSVSYYSLAGGGGGAGYGSVGQPGVGSISDTITSATSGTGTTGGRGGDRLGGVSWTPESGGGGGGGTYGDSAQLASRAYLGAGGGAGGGAETSTLGGVQLGASGGTGGGFICIGADTLTVYYNENGSYTDSGYIYAGGLAGSNSTYADRSNPGGGGGGAGGSIYIRATTVTNQNIYGIATFGGTGGWSPYYSGGDGGAGRALVESSTYTGYNPAPSTGPTVTTNPATTVTYNSGVLNGTVNPNGAASTAWFEWGTSLSYGSSTSAQDVGSGTDALSITATISGLVVSTTYYFRIAANNSSGTTYGSNQTFTTVLPDYRGTGADGPITVTSGTFNINTQTQQGSRSGVADGVAWVIDVNIPSGQSTISSTGARPSGFAVNDEVIIINLQGTSGDYSNVGLYEFRRVIALPTSNSITIVSPLANSYNGTNQRILVQRVPNYTDVAISGTANTNLTCSAWNGITGGVLALRATGTVSTKSNNYIYTYGRGHQGGLGNTSNASAYAGESYLRASYASGGTATTTTATAGLNLNPGGGGGAAGFYNDDFITYTSTAAAGTTGPAGGGGGGLVYEGGSFFFGGCGGGGGHGSVGLSTPYAWDGSGSSGGAGGEGFGLYGGDAGGGGLYGSSTALNTRAYFGAGGGAGGGIWGYRSSGLGYGYLNGLSGGTGGGFLFIGAETITGTGSINANGYAGGSYYDITYGFPGRGGGGAGGSLIIRANNIYNSGTISANGGRGGTDGFSEVEGGAGGAGRIYYQCNGYSGNPVQTRNGSAVEQSTSYYDGAPAE